MKKIIIIFSLFLMIFANNTKSYAQEEQKAKVWVIKFHADWCPSCQAIEPDFTALQDNNVYTL